MPATHLEAANRQFSDLTAKYRELLQSEQLHSVQVLVMTKIIMASNLVQLDVLTTLCTLGFVYIDYIPL